MIEDYQEKQDAADKARGDASEERAVKTSSDWASVCCDAGFLQALRKDKGE